MALAKKSYGQAKTDLARPNGLSSYGQMVVAIENMRYSSYMGASGHIRYSTIF
jgi:hypothetical protein